VSLPQSLQLCQNGGLSVLSSIKETEKSLRGPIQASGVDGDDSRVLIGQKFPCEKRKCEMVHCHDATASCFVAKVWGEVLAHFHTVAITCHGSMQN
jgi:hypothetical protein